MNIRQATPKDIPYILRLYKAGLDEMGISNYTEANLLNKIVVSYQLAPCFLVEVDDKIVGMAGLTTKIESWSQKATLCEYMFYVEPQHRSLRVLGGLVKKSKDFARENNFPFRLELTLQNDEALRKRLFKMYGFEPKAIVGVMK